MSSTDAELVLDIHGKPLSSERQEDWVAAKKMGLRPAIVYFINDEPLAVYADGSGIYGPCPRRSQKEKRCQKR